MEIKVAVPPELGAKSFGCPHCTAVAHQSWFKLFLSGYSSDEHPFVPASDVLQRIDQERLIESQAKAKFKDYFKKRLSGLPFVERQESDSFLRSQLDNSWASRCYSCEEFSLWVGDKLIWPNRKYLTAPNPDMPNEIKTDFVEAAAIVDLSARGAAALLRLCIQKIVIHLGEKGDNLNFDIGELVRKRKITKEIQEALDVVRVVGNNAVHPGVINFSDSKAVASKLFSLVNVIVEATIATPKHIAAMFETVVPEEKRAAIAKRDAPKQITGPDEVEDDAQHSTEINNLDKP
jgi:hypothetical protein